MALGQADDAFCVGDWFAYAQSRGSNRALRAHFFALDEGGRPMRMSRCLGYTSTGLLRAGEGLRRCRVCVQRLTGCGPVARSKSPPPAPE
jgi:hypothetical protein